MIRGFHTAGLLWHDEPTAVRELAALGYQCVAVRPRRGGLDPAAEEFPSRAARLGETAEAAGVAVVIDAEAKFLHDPHVVAGPSLVAVDEDQSRAARDWIAGWIERAPQLGSKLVTFAAGAPPSPLALADQEQILERLGQRLDELTSLSADAGVGLALRPARGQAVATVAQFERLTQWLADPRRLGVAADVGEMLLGGEMPLSDRLGRNLEALSCVYLCDARTGVAGDQRIGQGEVALGRLVRALAAKGYVGPAIVRVEGHADAGLVTEAEGLDAFEPLVYGVEHRSAVAVKPEIIGRWDRNWWTGSAGRAYHCRWRDNRRQQFPAGGCPRPGDESNSDSQSLPLAAGARLCQIFSPVQPRRL